MSIVSLSWVAVLLFLLGSWAKTALPMFDTTFAFMGLKKPEVMAYTEQEPTPEKTSISYGLESVISNSNQENIVVVMVTPTGNITPTPTATELPTMTPTITMTATIPPTETPTRTPTPEPVIHSPGIDPLYSSLVLGDPVDAKISYYWPPFCGTEFDPECINCNIGPDGEPDCDFVASGRQWHYEGVGRWMACYDRSMIGTNWLINGLVWECQDTGGNIVVDAEGYAWFDLLYPYMPYGFNWSEKITVYQVFEYEIDR